MSDLVAPSFPAQFATLRDPRQLAKVLYPLPKVLLLCGTVAGVPVNGDLASLRQCPLAIGQAVAPLPLVARAARCATASCRCACIRRPGRASLPCCAIPMLVPLAMLRQEGASSVLANALETARRRCRRSLPGAPTRKNEL